MQPLHLSVFPCSFFAFLMGDQVILLHYLMYVFHYSPSVEHHELSVFSSEVPFSNKRT
jgi:hypothetical protein